ncbi:MAG: M23 family metallopeptidase, partial [Peptostreptococcaceae bacterium]|nr:M23 family metallopeptidase [Peptostreptococcaceae bacterium]
GTGQLGIPVTHIEVSSAYGSRGGGSHVGVDLRAPRGSAIMAADGGTVVKACYSGSYGNLIIINHGNGIQTYYGHCDSMNVSVGDQVTKGQVIGTVGATGNATGNHLHFEVRVNGIPQNPFKFF